MCIFCYEEYNNSVLFREHMETEHANFKIETAFAFCPLGYIKADCTDIRCRLCSEKHPTLKSIAKHLCEVHKKNLNCEGDLGIQPYKFLDKKILCGVCNCNFPGIRQLGRHISSHFKNFTCEECGKSYSTRCALRAHLRMSHITEDRICRKCKQTFKSLEEKKEHTASSPKCWKYHCTACSQRFITWKYKEEHLVEVHGRNKKSHTCPECGEIFLSRCTYRVHFTTNHADVCFACSECARKFSNQKDLDRHSVIHTGIKIYECDVCSKSFPRKSNLQQHMWIHSEYKRFECVPCNKKFNQKVSYRSHMKTHHSM